MISPQEYLPVSLFKELTVVRKNVGYHDNQRLVKMKTAEARKVG
jgi:hypothetical protein